jgi:hypothetical protein
MSSKQLYFVTANAVVYAHDFKDARAAAKKGLQHQHELDLFYVDDSRILQLDVSDVTTQQDIDNFCLRVGAGDAEAPLLDASKILDNSKTDFLIDEPWTSFSLKSYLEERKTLNEIAALRQRIFELEKKFFKIKK